MTVSTEFATATAPERRLVLWRCNSCRRFIPNGALYLLSDYVQWHVRHAVLCIPKDHEASMVLRLPVKKIRFTDQFNWWLTYLEHANLLPPPATDAFIHFLGQWASFPPGWRPQRADLTQPMPVGVA